MGGMKRYWEQRALEEFGELTADTLDTARLMVAAELKAITAGSTGEGDSGLEQEE